MADKPSIFVVSALAGNSWRESHVNPTIGQNGGSAFGMFQWDGVRKTRLLEWLRTNGYSATSPQGQMEYLVVENDWMGTNHGISSLGQFLHSDSTDVAGLTEAFCKCWERPGVPAMQDRLDFAFAALDFISEHAEDENIFTWKTEPQYYLSWQDALNNAVLMYRHYNGGVTPPIPPHPHPEGRKGGKIWMWVRYR